ncbi:hypothetical protein [Silanimonas sp.]|jgi:outer membrane protein OmpA-like peptidoglycan-associated protein|uniref:hypothetical protein n=1 Tax=Silanimonas sp. TaxID=1929290 RepID=UPI0022C96BDC|nr:hypothetical protein [Silanimonas sp.]MCE2907500.1 hypothetical protein [Burkholderiaceae bacterium]MCZ8167297.1 hypothetical protein [Silanimonas sp.]
MAASEEKFLEAARKGKFSVSNWQAMTGIGRFDAVYQPQANLMNVTLKVFTEFRDFDQVWRDDEKLAWEPRAFRTIEDFWSRRFLFQCTRPGWQKYSVNVDVKLVARPKADAHMHLMVDKRPPTMGTQGGGVDWSPQPPLCMIDNLAIEPKDQRKLREGIFALRLLQMGQGLTERGLGTVAFAANSADLAPADKIKLLDYAKFVHRIATNDVTGIELVVFGGTGSGDGIFQSGLGKRRARAVADILGSVIRDDTKLTVTDSSSKRPGLKPILLSALSAAAGKTVTSTSFRGVVIVPYVGPDIDRAAERNYIVLAHEFGHMLGLPDEYMGRLHPLLTDRVNADNMISRTLQLATKAGDPASWTDSDRRKAAQQGGMAEMLRYNPDVKAPTFMDQTQIIDNVQVSSNSIMYGGMEVMPAHYLTLWSCLCEMTWGYLDPRHWKIVPSPHNRSGIRYF